MKKGGCDFPNEDLVNEYKLGLNYINKRLCFNNPLILPLNFDKISYS